MIGHRSGFVSQKFRTVLLVPHRLVRPGLGMIPGERDAKTQKRKVQPQSWPLSKRILSKPTSNLEILDLQDIPNSQCVAFWIFFYKVH